MGVVPLYMKFVLSSEYVTWRVLGGAIDRLIRS